MSLRRVCSIYQAGLQADFFWTHQFACSYNSYNPFANEFPVSPLVVSLLCRNQLRLCICSTLLRCCQCWHEKLLQVKSKWLVFSAHSRVFWVCKSLRCFDSRRTQLVRSFEMHLMFCLTATTAAHSNCQATVGKNSQKACRSDPVHFVHTWLNPWWLDNSILGTDSWAK